MAASTRTALPRISDSAALVGASATAGSNRVRQVVHSTTSPTWSSGITGTQNRVNQRRAVRRSPSRSPPQRGQKNATVATVRNRIRIPKISSTR